MDGQIEENNALLNENIERRGYRYNQRKQELVPSLRRRASQRAIFTSSRFADRCKAHARHLGGLLSWNGKNGHEVNKRTRALCAGWARLQGSWTEQMPWKLVRMLFLSLVQSAALTGLESYVITRTEARRIDVELTKRLRVLMKGKACAETIGSTRRCPTRR